MPPTYGLKKRKAQASVADVDQALDKNTGAIMDVASQLVNGVNGYLKENEGRLDNVVQRLVNSVNGHLKRNLGVLKPIGNELLAHVDGMLAQNDAILHAAASDPAIADYLRTAPLAHGYQLRPPTAPPAEPSANDPAPPMRGQAPRLLPGTITGLSPLGGPPPPSPPPSPPAGPPTSYTLWFNCQSREWAAVPNYTPDGSWGGFRPPPPWAGGYGWPNPIEELPAYLVQFGEQMFMASCPHYAQPG